MNFQVLYRSIFDLVRDFMKDEAFSQQDRTLRRYLNPELLIIDDFGLKQLPKNSGEHLFEVIMRRYENRSTIMTSNRPRLGRSWIVSCTMPRPLPLPGGTTGSKTTPPLQAKRIKTNGPNPSPTNLRPQNRRAEWLATGSARFTLLLTLVENARFLRRIGHTGRTGSASPLKIQMADAARRDWIFVCQ
jgi:hypothetical protein